MDFRGIRILDLHTIVIDDHHVLNKVLDYGLLISPSKKMKFFAVIDAHSDAIELNDVEYVDGLFLADMIVVDSLGNVHHTETKICWWSEV